MRYLAFASVRRHERYYREMDGEAPCNLTVTLDAAEWQFLITVLRASTCMLNALLALQHSLPDAIELPITADAVVNVVALANRIEEQTGSPSA
jgi:hypothetical protein